ncbi:ATP-dependent DNA helicase RecG [Parabacteroides sp. FAFU027]|uniref:ATP-dependent DNA helicase RecG n=1 Tax=Parabacteroides sp. FAFU027 TaxID=2922715 RepID=UPI001FAFC3A8|nr:ATP-dependent DNA helicase RecG [Parabacteroides sp. FAFU027]
MNLAQQDIKFLPGVGEKRGEVLKQELEIRSFEDLLYYFPYKYIDRSRMHRVCEINADMMYVQLKGRILSFETQGEGMSKRLTAKFTDGTGVIELVWFKGLKFVTGKYLLNTEYIVFGKPNIFNNKINLPHPDIDVYDEAVEKQAGALQAFYNTTEKMKNQFLNSRMIQKLVYNLFTCLKAPFGETLTPQITQRAKVISLNEALYHIHFPKSQDLLRKAEYRLKFEELFFIQLNILRYSKLNSRKLGGFVFTKIGDYFNTFYNQNLPFELTNAQKRVLKEIRENVRTGHQMNRLVQGDVGSGKTLVAFMSMLMALDNGYQACMMAPTEILATQHYETVHKLSEELGINVVLLTGSSKKAHREKVHQQLLTGDIHIIIGTHALLEDIVQFDNLGMAIIDEQHRFGVAQRARLWAKNKRPPHILVMTATPIPRTLAMTLYGDLDVSVIDELPPGRKPIQTLHQYDNRRGTLYSSIRKQLELGRQVYIVYPLIQESEKADWKNLEEGFEHIQEVFPEYNVCMVHGKLKAKEKDAAMQLFVSGEAHIMVATTVIEVGVNVPNASVMVIESAERFGLSQLHQLRGRVGRGADQSFCVLVTSHKLSEVTRKRMEIMVRTNDGFEIAEADLKLRGPGDLEGTQQSGDPFNLKIANLVHDGQVLQLARDIATEVVNDDPELKSPSNLTLKNQLDKLFRKKVDWSLIS